MLAGRNKTLKSQDILILLKMVSKADKDWRIIDLAHELDISPSEITMGLERLRISSLIDSTKRKAHKDSVLEFLVHGLKYVFPAQLGPVGRGVPTAHSLVEFSNQFVNDSKFVWEYAEGSMKGSTISPIYHSAPFAASKDEKLHRLLALIDMLRVGRVREQAFAKLELQKELQV